MQHGKDRFQIQNLLNNELHHKLLAATTVHHVLYGYDIVVHYVVYFAILN